MNKVILSFLLIVGFALTAQSQNDQKQKDSATVHRLIISLFDGMREGDSAKVSSTFHKDVKMYTSFTDKEGQLVLKKGETNFFPECYRHSSW